TTTTARARNSSSSTDTKSRSAWESGTIIELASGEGYLVRGGHYPRRLTTHCSPGTTHPSPLTSPMTLAQRCQPIELILSDVDGVLTDGSIVYDNQGIETKRFFVRDGLGIRLWQRAGGKFGLVTARSSHIVKVR